MSELLRKWRRAGYRLDLFYTGKRDEYGKHILSYCFFDKGKLIFEGDDFHCSPLDPIDSLQAVYTLLSFLSLKPGDTDAEYFDTYTPHQLEWANGNRCEELSCMIPDKYR